MKLEISLPYSTSEIVGTRKLSLSFEQDQVSWADVINCLSRMHGEKVKTSLLDSEGNLQYHYFVNGNSQDPREPLKNGDHVLLMEPISGG